MKFAAMLFSLAAIAFAQDTDAGATRKLESITWDLQSEKLVWLVQTGTMVNGKFSVNTEDRYEITPADAVMAFSNEKRGFTQDEATSLRHLLDVLSLYCAESVAWWDDGQGVPLDGSGKPTRPQRQTPGERERSGRPTKVARPNIPPKEQVKQLKLEQLVALAR